MKHDVKKLVLFILDTFHIDLSIFEQKHQQKVIQKWMKSINVDTVESAIEYLKGFDEIDINLVNSFNNHFSMFFRNEHAFSTLKKEILQAFSKETRDLRVWSIGCSKGQEAYSIAILFEDIMMDYDIAFDYTIFASDTSLYALEKARMGVYRKEEVNNLKLRQLDNYFTKDNGNYYVKDELKKNIVFTKHDIVLDESKYPKESIFGDFDIVLINNVMIYYNLDIQKDIIGKVYHAVRHKGCIITTEAEVDLFSKRNGSKRVSYESSILRKD